MNKIKLPDGVEPIKKRERARLLRTINQRSGKESITTAEHLDNEALYKLFADAKETKQYVLDNKNKFGENYTFALQYSQEILGVLEKEIKKRSKNN